MKVQRNKVPISDFSFANSFSLFIFLLSTLFCFHVSASSAFGLTANMDSLEMTGSCLNDGQGTAEWEVCSSITVNGESLGTRCSYLYVTNSGYCGGEFY